MLLSSDQERNFLIVVRAFRITRCVATAAVFSSATAAT